MDPQRETPSGLPRARVFDVPFEGSPGPNNAITDVSGLAVGYTTLIAGENIRTGVTAILPRGREDLGTPCWSGLFSLNGNGEMTGSHWIEETGSCELAVTITNTHSVGVARDATIKWATRNPVPRDGMDSGLDWGLPVAAETYDGYLNDINGFHLTEEHVFAAIESATTGPLEEGSVGGGTGMICYGFKGGSGSASRQVESYTLGAFVQANFGRPQELTVAGVPVGRELEGGFTFEPGGSSIIAVIATDAPLLPHQLKRLARRAALGIGRSGAVAHHSSGDIFLALSTANREALQAGAGRAKADFLPDASLDGLFVATIQAVDEAVLNALFANQDMTGRGGHTIRALPRERVREILARHGRIAD